MTHKHGKFRILDEAEVLVQDLIDDPENANKHDEENLAAIMASLRRFKQPERLVRRKCDGVVFAGNGRAEALRRLGWKTARVQHVEGSDTECRAYAIAANQTTRMSRWDNDILLPQLQELRDADAPLLDATGFDLQDIEDLEHLLEENHAQAEASLARGEGGSLATCPKCGTEFRLGGAKE